MNIEEQEVIGRLTTGHNIEGITHPLIVLKNNKKYIAKGLSLTENKVYNYVMFNEIICSLIAPYFKVNLPDYFINYYNNTYWYCSEYIEGMFPYPNLLSRISSNDLANIAIFDIYFSNRDRRFSNLVYSTSPSPKLWLIDHGRCLLAPLTSWVGLNKFPLDTRELILIPILYDALGKITFQNKLEIDWDFVYSESRSIPNEWLPCGQKDISNILRILELRQNNLLDAIKTILYKYNNGELRWSISVI